MFGILSWGYLVGVSSFQILIAPFILELFNDDSLPHSVQITEYHPSLSWTTITDVTCIVPFPPEYLCPVVVSNDIPDTGMCSSSAPHIQGLILSCNCGGPSGRRFGLNPISVIFTLLSCRLFLGCHTILVAISRVLGCNIAIHLHTNRLTRLCKVLRNSFSSPSREFSEILFQLVARLFRS